MLRPVVVLWGCPRLRELVQVELRTPISLARRAGAKTKRSGRAGRFGRAGAETTAEPDLLSMPPGLRPPPCYAPAISRRRRLEPQSIARDLRLDRVSAAHQAARLRNARAGRSFVLESVNEHTKRKQERRPRSAPRLSLEVGPQRPAGRLGGNGTARHTTAGQASSAGRWLFFVVWPAHDDGRRRHVYYLERRLGMLAAVGPEN
jgi:hypothetical protein